MFQLKKNYTGEKEFSLTLRQLDGSAPKVFSNKVSKCFAIRPKKSFKKKDDYLVIDTSIVRGIKSTILYISTLVKAQNLMIFLQNIQTQDLYRGFR